MILITQVPSVIAKWMVHHYCCAERLKKLEEIESKWEEKKEVLDQELAKLEVMLANTFDRYLKLYGWR